MYIQTTNSVIRINSEDTQNGYARLNRSISNGTQIYAKLSWAQTNYNITSPAAFVVDGTPYYVPVGFYTQQAACSMLALLLGADYTVAPDTYSKLVTISNITSTIFVINASQCDIRLMDLLGFSVSAGYAGSTFYTGQTVGSGGYKGCGMTVIIEGIPKVMQGDCATRNQGAFIFVPYNAFGTTSSFSDYVPVRWEVMEQQEIRDLQIRFVDFYGADIDFNGGSWVLQLVVEGCMRDRWSIPEDMEL